MNKLSKVKLVIAALLLAFSSLARAQAWGVNGFEDLSDFRYLIFLQAKFTDGRLVVALNRNGSWAVSDWELLREHNRELTKEYLWPDFVEMKAKGWMHEEDKCDNLGAIK